MSIEFTPSKQFVALRIFIAFLVAMAWMTIDRQLAFAGDSHATYYYPTPQTSEVYASFAKVDEAASRSTRIGFTVGLNAKQRKLGYAPRFHLFAKGANSQKLIIVGVESGAYNTLYRLRALLAALTADARASPFFTSPNVPADANFLDLCKLIGFELVTISDGDTLAHQIKLF